MERKINMRELTEIQQCEIQGGSMIASGIIYILIGAGIYKIIRSKRGRVSIPRLVSIEWGN